MSSENDEAALARLTDAIRKEDERYNKRLKHRQSQEGQFTETVTLARAAFVSALYKAAPAELDELRALIPRHRAALSFVSGESWETVSQVRVPAAVPELLGCVKGWAAARNLAETKDDWLLRASLHLLQVWAHSGQNAVMLPSYVLAPFSVPDADERWEPPTFDFREMWDPRRDTKTNAGKRARTKFKGALKRYLEWVELEALTHGVSSGYEPHGLRDGTPLDAVRLVHFQGLGKTYTSIAGPLGDYQAVNSGVKRYAALIGMTLRPNSKGGRPSR